MTSVGLSAVLTLLGFALFIFLCFRGVPQFIAISDAIFTYPHKLPLLMLIHARNA